MKRLALAFLLVLGLPALAQVAVTPQTREQLLSMVEHTPVTPSSLGHYFQILISSIPFLHSDNYWTGSSSFTGGILIDNDGTLGLGGPFSAAGTPLPSCTSHQGAIAFVTDATDPTWHGTYTSGGGVVSAVLCNGTVWIIQ